MNNKKILFAICSPQYSDIMIRNIRMSVTKDEQVIISTISPSVIMNNDDFTRSVKDIINEYDISIQDCVVLTSWRSASEYGDLEEYRRSINRFCGITGIPHKIFGSLRPGEYRHTERQFLGLGLSRTTASPLLTSIELQIYST